MNKLLMRLIVPILDSLSDELVKIIVEKAREAVTEKIAEIESVAKNTPNPLDDLFVKMVKILFEID